MVQSMYEERNRMTIIPPDDANEPNEEFDRGVQTCLYVMANTQARAQIYALTTAQVTLLNAQSSLLRLQYLVEASNLLGSIAKEYYTVDEGPYKIHFF